MRDVWWYIWNFLLGVGGSLFLVVVSVKVFPFLCKKILK